MYCIPLVRSTTASEKRSSPILARLPSWSNPTPATDDLAAARSQFATVSAPFTRDGDGTQIINQAVATSVFSAGPDTHGWAVNGDGDYLVYHVTDVTPPSTPPAQDITDFLTNGTRDALYADFISGITDELWPQSVRGGAYQRMLTLLTTTAAQ